jgi:beta-glucosidase
MKLMMDAREAVAGLLGQLTDAEKVSLTAGADAWTTAAVERLGVPALRVGDGPHGVRKPHDGSGMSMFDSHPATCFPTAVTLGSTWDPELVREVGVALGREAAGHGIGVLLGPGVNLKRTPIGGRNFEYFSEDPLVSSRLGAAWVDGVQSTGVGASLKHFAANNTEQRRYGVNAVVDERALRELYLASFEPVVRHHSPATVMAAYNQLNGRHCTENSWLLGDILRGEWGFEGVVVSDWGATWDRAVSIPAGSDLAMPGLGARDDDYVREALRSGALPREALDAAAARILELVAQHGGGIASGGQGSPGAGPEVEVAVEPDLDAHHALARRAAAAGTVLLKNDGGLLPLGLGARGPGGGPVAGPGAGQAPRAAAGARIALVGAFADEPRFQGAGSSHVVPTRLDSLRGALVEALGPAEVVYAPGYDRLHATSTPVQIAQAQAAARSAEVAIVVVGLPETFETEGVDREHLRLPDAHDLLVTAVLAVNPKTVVVLQNGSPVELPWRQTVPAIVEAHLGGQAGGTALADVLLGRAEPGGRLAETFPEQYADHPVSRLPNGPVTAEYRESLFVGYRYFDSAHEEVAFPFGHGLSYATFEWSDVECDVIGGGGLAGDRDSSAFLAEVTVTVTNTSERAGDEVVQVYVHDEESSVFRPEQELRGFAKLRLQPGGSERVTIRLDRRAFSFWDAASGGWVLEPGRFEIRVGRSSRDILGRSIAELWGPSGIVVTGATTGISAYRSPSRDRGFPQDDFERLLGHAVPPNRAAEPGSFSLDTAVRDMQQSLAGRILFRYLKREGVKTIGAPAEAPVDAVAGEVVAQLTFRMFPTVSEASFSRRRTLQLLALVNRLSGFGRRWTRRRARRSGPPDGV